jgi:hypothetical protein
MADAGPVQAVKTVTVPVAKVPIGTRHTGPAAGSTGQDHDRQIGAQDTTVSRSTGQAAALAST